MRPGTRVVPALWLLVAACAPQAEAPAPARTLAADAFAPPTQLAAALADHSHVDLKWKNNAGEAGGYFVEFTMNPGEEYTVLDVVPPGTEALRHPDVAPDTLFTYRVRPLFGRPSDVVSVMTGKAVEGATAGVEGPLEEKPLPSGGPGPKSSIRNSATFAEARPVDLRAALSAPTEVDLRWQDRAADEEGYVVELRTDVEREFRVRALLPPNTTTFKKTNLPPSTACHFRVRAYYSGHTSNTAAVRTPVGTGNIARDVQM